MRALIQRVSQARVDVADQSIASIDHGLLVLLGVERDDDEAAADKMLHKLLHYRVFSDEDGKMNLNVQQAEGSLLIVSQFTLAADTSKGLRPGFSTAAQPQKAEKLYNFLLDQAKKSNLNIACGEFAANMQVHLCNDGPVTFLLEVN